MENYILRNYGVVFKYFKNEDDFTQIHFKTEVTYKGELKDGNHYFVINKKRVFINGIAPDLLVEQMAESAGSCLYPMEIITNSQGPFEEIANYDEIKKRWDLKKIEFQNYYEGEIAEKIIKKLDIIYSSKTKLEIAMKDDLFLTLFFMPIYRKHVDRVANYEIEIVFIPFEQPISFQIIQEVKPYLSKSNKQLLNLKGYCDQAINSQPELELDYKIDNETKSLSSIIGSVDLKIAKDSVNKIEIEVIQLFEN